jgi:hypothetical protein
LPLPFCPPELDPELEPLDPEPDPELEPEPDPGLPALDPEGGAPAFVGAAEDVFVVGELDDVPPHATIPIAISAAQMAGTICSFMRASKAGANYLFKMTSRCCRSVL